MHIRSNQDFSAINRRVPLGFLLIGFLLVLATTAHSESNVGTKKSAAAKTDNHFPFPKKFMV